MNAIDVEALDRRIARELGENPPHTAAWLADMIASEVNGIAIPEELGEVADFIGDSKKYSTLSQLLFVKLTAERDPAIADAVLQKMDQLRDVANDTQRARADEQDLVGDISGPGVS